MKYVFILSFLSSIIFLCSCATISTWSPKSGFCTEHGTVTHQFSLSREKKTLQVSTSNEITKYWVPFDFYDKIPCGKRIEKSSVTIPLDKPYRNSAVFEMIPVRDESMPLRKNVDGGIPLYVPKDEFGWIDLFTVRWIGSLPLDKIPSELRLNPGEWKKRNDPFYLQQTGNIVLLIPFHEEQGKIKIYIPDFQEALPYFPSQGSSVPLKGAGVLCWRILWTPPALVVDLATLPLQIAGLIALKATHGGL